MVGLMLLSAFNAFGQEAPKPEADAKVPVKTEPAKQQSEKVANKPQFSLSVKTKPIPELQFESREGQTRRHRG